MVNPFPIDSTMVLVEGVLGLNEIVEAIEKKAGKDTDFHTSPHIDRICFACEIRNILKHKNK